MRINTTVTIAEIKNKSDELVGELVIIKGVYMGWKGEGPPPVTRSDWVIDDNTGAIYITGKSPNLDPIKDVGKNITVVGYVRLKDTTPYIEAVKVIAE